MDMIGMMADISISSTCVSPYITNIVTWPPIHHCLHHRTSCKSWQTCNCGGAAPGSMLFAGEYSLGMCLSMKHFLHWPEPSAWEMRETLGKFSKQVPHQWNRVAAMAEWKALIFWWTAGWPNSGAEWSISLHAWYRTQSCSWCIFLTGVVSLRLLASVLHLWASRRSSLSGVASLRLLACNLSCSTEATKSGLTVWQTIKVIML